MGSYQSNTSLPIGDTSTWVDFEKDWFARGASRLAYRGTYHGDPCREGKKCVVKVYEEEWYERLGKYAWKADDRASRKAQEMAQLFNIKHQTNKPIEFLIPEITRVNTRAAFKFLGFIPFSVQVKGKMAGTSASSHEMIPEGATIAIEKYLEGDYIKFLSNSSYVKLDTPAFAPSAFSHFTYHESKGKILVCDIQGVRRDTKYEFTDPAIHSMGDRLGLYGATDLGVYGIVKFFQNHHCNDLCKRFLKPDLSRIPRDAMADMNRILQAIQVRHSSTYTYELQAPGVTSGRIGQLQRQIRLPAIAE